MVMRKTSELEGAELDCAVALALGHQPHIKRDMDGEVIWCTVHDWNKPGTMVNTSRCQPSTDWSQGGPILARMIESGEWGAEPFGDGTIIVSNTNSECLPYSETWDQENVDELGETLLIAAMRAFVARKLGDEVEVPV